MSKNKALYSVEETVNYCLNSDESDIDSCCGGLSEDEEEELDELLLQDPEISVDDRADRYVNAFCSTTAIFFCFSSFLHLPTLKIPKLFFFFGLLITHGYITLSF